MSINEIQKIFDRSVLGKEPDMRLKKRKIRTSLILLCTIPLLGFAWIVLLITSGIIYNSLKAEVKYSLYVLTNASYQSFDQRYPGDYTQKEDTVLKGDINISQCISGLDDIKNMSGADTTIFYGGIRYLTTIRNEDGTRATGTGADRKVVGNVLIGGQDYFSDNVLVNGVKYFGYYMPIKNTDGRIVGMAFTGKPRDQVMREINRNIYMVCILAAVTLLIVVALILHFSSRLVFALSRTELFLEEISRGNLKAEIEPYVLKRQDEIGGMGRFAVMLQKSIEDLIGKDPLTGLGNRRSCDIVLKSLIEQGKRCGNIFTIVMGDIDHFKQVNDTYGHQAGDEILKKVSETMKEHMERLGFVFRWGGEEFLLIYEDLVEAEAVCCLKELYNAVNMIEVQWKEEKIKITMTFGVAEFCQDPAIGELVQRADANLYEGKRIGRNCIICSGFNCSREETEEK